MVSRIGGSGECLAPGRRQALDDQACGTTGSLTFSPGVPQTRARTMLSS
jgi:hypothetical protein